MVHLLTTHVGHDRWVELQGRRLERHTDEPIRTWAVLDDETRARHGDRFDRVQASRGNVGLDLNGLAASACAEADAGDILVFLDGDAFPVGDWLRAIRRWLARFRLAAVRRDELLRDHQPHHLFCATTAGYWTEIGGDWRRGPVWTASTGRPVTDHGAVLLRQLAARGDDWHPILRSNLVDWHPIWFALYGDVIYHHGAGFRPRASRYDAEQHRSLPGPLARAARWRDVRAATRLAERVYARLLADEPVIAELRGETIAADDPRRGALLPDPGG